MAESKQLQDKVKMLTAKKQSLFRLVQNMYDLSLDVSNEKLKSSFLVRIHSVDNIRKEFIEVMEHLNLAEMELNPKSTADFTSLISFDELYCYIKSVGSQLSAVAAANAHALSQLNKSNNYDVLRKKLPALELMSFDGSPQKWVMFYENFSTLIHNNHNLSNAEKIQYLIGKLSGKALTVCAGIPPVASNYEILWNALKEKYQDNRTMATMYLEQMLNFKGSQSPSQNSLDTFIENFCSAQSALKQLDIPDLADFIFTHIAISKLDKETVTLFEQAHRDEKLPTFDLLIKFVKEQSKIYMLRSTNSSSSTSYSKNNQKSFTPQTNKNYVPQKTYKNPVQSFVVNNGNNYPACPHCNKENDHLYTDVNHFYI